MVGSILGFSYLGKLQCEVVLVTVYPAAYLLTYLLTYWNTLHKVLFQRAVVFSVPLWGAPCHLSLGRIGFVGYRGGAVD